MYLQRVHRLETPAKMQWWNFVMLCEPPRATSIVPALQGRKQRTTRSEATASFLRVIAPGKNIEEAQRLQHHPMNCASRHDITIETTCLSVHVDCPGRCTLPGAGLLLFKSLTACRKANTASS